MINMERAAFISLLFSLYALLPFIASAQQTYSGTMQYDSYKGLVMAGYQGWHNAEGDGANRGWYHYRGRTGFHPGSTNVDLWPDVSEYPKVYPSPFTFDDGTTAYLQSAYDYSTVDTHFRWMQEYGLDGVFMQRFVGEIRNESGRHHFSTVLSHAMTAANKYGRAIAVMYDLSGMQPGDEQVLLDDIRQLAHEHSIMEHAKNPSYLYHNGRPLVTVWGVGFNDHRRYGLREAQTIVSGLKQMGFSVMIGVPTHWRDLEDDTESDPQLLDIIRQCDVVMPWFVGRYNEETYKNFHSLIRKDIAWSKTNGVDYAPLCFPGFSWKNMHYPHTPAVTIPRNKGSFFRKQLDFCLSAGAEMLYIAMFDEIDEGTAIYKIARKVPTPAPGSTFTPLEEGIGSDHYLKIAGQAAQQLKQTLTVGTALVYPHPFAPSDGFVKMPEKPCRSELCLNGYWDFQPVGLPADFVHGKGETPELPLPKPGAWESTRIKIPSPWNVNAFAYRNLEGPDHRNYPSYPALWNDVKMAWMRKTVSIPSEWNGKQLSVHFEAVAGETVVYVNGRKAGENFDLFLPFDVDVTDYVRAGETAEILVGVRSQWLFEDNSTVGRRIVPAGSMWGYDINGIWQDVYLVATPKVAIADVFVKPLVSQHALQLEITLQNHTGSKASGTLQGNVFEWLNKAGTDVNAAPVPSWELGRQTLGIPSAAYSIAPNAQRKMTITIPVSEQALRLWTPEQPNLYGLVLTLKTGTKVTDTKYERFGWREWTFSGTQLCLNGQPYSLRSDSWHFMGIPQMTRRYAWAWYSAIKGMNGNAVRLHAQVYPRLYMEMADEMGICVLDETANWASDGGPKLDSEVFFEHSRDHLRRFVLRDRNYPSVFGWSISNENKPVILYVFKRPDLLPRQKEEWAVWRDIVMETDPTRPWISSDGEDDGDGILPVTVGHYGDGEAMKKWQQIGKPWGIGETGMCYYGTPRQTSKFNGQRAYESAEGRMEGLANECYHLIREMREMGASYSTVFNMAWYALKPLPLGKRDVTTAPTLHDGIFFGEYQEGLPGVQPERVGPYSSTFNPGYDPNLPLYEPWPLYEALRAANAQPVSAWSRWADVDTLQYRHHPIQGSQPYAAVLYIGSSDSQLKRQLDAQGVVFSVKPAKKGGTLYIVDASDVATCKDFTLPTSADVWLWGLTPESASCFRLNLLFDRLARSSFLPENRSWMAGMQNADFYFCEDQQTDASQYTLRGPFVDEAEVLLNACKTDWRRWNLQPEEIKTAGLLRSENETTEALPVFVKHGNIYVSTLTDFTGSQRGFNTLSAILQNAGIPCQRRDGASIRSEGIYRDANNLLLDPSIDTSKKTTK